jgi:hypothetical protein
MEPLTIDDEDLARVAQTADPGSAELAVEALPQAQRDAVLARVVAKGTIIKRLTLRSPSLLLARCNRLPHACAALKSGSVLGSIAGVQVGKMSVAAPRVSRAP